MKKINETVDVLEKDFDKDLLDDMQKTVNEHFSSNSPFSNQDFCTKFIQMTTYYRRNLHRFAKDYLGIRLHLYQQIILYFMGISDLIAIIACRSASKSFVIAIYSCCIGVLYPKSSIIISSGLRDQSRLIISAKIKNELYPNSIALQREIKNISTQTSDPFVEFYNGSKIQIVTLGFRGARATKVIGEEAREIDKKKFDKTIVPMLYVRPAQFLTLDYYADAMDLREKPSQIYISSSIEEEHWLYKLSKECRDGMFSSNGSMFLAFDLSILLKHGIKLKEQLEKEHKNTDPITWAIEYENAVLRTNTKAFFTYDIIKDNLIVEKPFFPRFSEDVIVKKPNKYAIKKVKGEIRIVAADIALIDRNGNDNSCFTCLRCIPEVEQMYNGKNQVKFKYQVPYLEANRGTETTKQAVRIRQLYDDFEADYIVLDTRSGGTGIYDALTKILYDNERCVEYEPFKAMNDEAFANRVYNAEAKPVIYCVNATIRFNSETAINMKSLLLEHRIELLVSKDEGSSFLRKFVPEYKTDDADIRLFYERPYLETMLLFSEMVGLEYDKTDLGLIKIHEKGKMTKDRYSSLSYGCMFGAGLERQLLSEEEIDMDSASMCVSQIAF